MRRAFLCFAFAIFAAAPAAAQTAAIAAEAPSARIAFAERRALLAADTQCRLFTPSVRGALDAGAWQARNALLRAGWTSARIAELNDAAIAAARGQACNDPRTLAAAARARAGFEGWARMPSQTFSGGERAWLARRSPDENGWMLRQYLGGGATFGVRRGERAEATLTLPLRPSETAPASAELSVRDVARSRLSLFEVPGRRASGLEAGLPSPVSARQFRARERRIETDRRGARTLIFIFPDEALVAMTALDPREAAVIRMENGARVLVEIGDLGPARAFLALGAR